MRLTSSCCKDERVLPPCADLSPDSVSGLRNCRTSMSVAVEVVAAICPSWPGPVMEILKSASTIPIDEFVSIADGLEWSVYLINSLSLLQQAAVSPLRLETLSFEGRKVFYLRSSLWRCYWDLALQSRHDALETQKLAFLQSHTLSETYQSRLHRQQIQAMPSKEEAQAGRSSWCSGYRQDPH